MYQPITGDGDGTAPVVNLTFPYLLTDHVKAEVDGTEVSYTWTGASQITLDAAVAVGSSWRVYRDTALTDALVDFTSGSLLTEADLDQANTQHQYIDQELSARVNTAQATADAAAADAATAVEAASAIADVPNATAHAATRGVMALLSTATPAYLAEAGREGEFVFDASDLSAEVAADTQEGIYVAPSSDATGASGAWVRKFSGPADVRWFGAQADNATNDAVALQAALNVAGDVEIPAGKTVLLSVGDIRLPSGSTMRLSGDLRYDGATQYVFRVLGSQSDITVLGPGTISSDVDVEFLQIFRLEQDLGETLDGFRISGGIKMNYTDTTHTGSGDRWFVVGNQAGTRKNVIIEDVILTGWMQLTASMASSGVFKDSEIRNNRVHNADSNAISISATGGVSATNEGRAENIRITGNTITADASGQTSTGIFIGVDGSSDDQQAFLQDIFIEDNYIDIADSPASTSDILIRLGNDVSNIGGLLSTADRVVLHNNKLFKGLHIDQPNITTALAKTQVTNFQFTSNKVYGGDLIFSHMAGSAILDGNTVNAATGGLLRPGPNNGEIISSHNTWSGFLPNSSSNDVTWHSKQDTFLGSSGVTNNRTITLNAASGAVQTLSLTHCVVDSLSATPYSGIRVTGTGTNTVNVRHLSTDTSWGLGLFERASGTINDYTGSVRLNSSTFDPPSLAVGAADVVRTITATGAQIGDAVEIGFSTNLNGVQIVAWVGAADTISFYLQNPPANPNGTVDVSTGHAIARFYSQDA